MLHYALQCLMLAVKDKPAMSDAGIAEQAGRQELSAKLAWPRGLAAIPRVLQHAAFAPAPLPAQL